MQLYEELSVVLTDELLNIVQPIMRIAVIKGDEVSIFDFGVDVLCRIQDYAVILINGAKCL